jgi:tetratricopeptide (TPR) repeat protein
MRTHLFRGLTLVVLLVVSSAPALAQSVLRGKVSDAQGKPVPDATIVFEATEANRKSQTKTDKNGEFLQVGLQSGAYKVTASKDKVGSQTLNATVRQGPNAPMSFTITAASSLTTADKEAASVVQASASAAVEAMKAGRHDEAIAKFNEVIAKVPTCQDCYYNLGVAYAAKQQYTEAETAFKKVIELKPDSADAYTGLTNIYNAQKKFDLAAEVSAKAAEFANAGGAGGAAGAEASYNQGVILFNAGKFAEARVQFEAASKTDPTMAMAHYQLGMTSLNLGLIPEAIAALEAYLKVEPTGTKAGEVKSALPALQGMLKK